jgi:Fuc2NAc and GlcNAc transferase
MVAVAGRGGSSLVIAGVIVSFVAALATIPALEWWARSRNLLDIPNARSSHTSPTPRVGGIGIVAGVALGQVAAWLSGFPAPVHAAALASGALVLTAVSVVDDVRSLPALVRLIAQCAIAGAIAWQAAQTLAMPLGDALPALGPVLMAVWIVGLVNAYNFMDGIDGIAGGQAIVAAAGWAIVGVVTGVPALAGTALFVAAASAAFLRFNWPPARVFMGDGGSAFLGFVFAVLPLSAPSAGRSVLAAVCFLWPFLFDTTFTLFRRLSRRENVLQAHRSHLYQRLTSTGLSHGRVTRLYVALAALGMPSGVCVATGRWTPALALGAVVPLAALSLWSITARLEARAASRLAVSRGSDAISGG